MKNELSISPFHDPIVALIPCYDARGDATRIVHDSGLDRTLPQSVTSVLHRIAKRRGLQLSYLRAARKGERRTAQPIPIDTLHTFLPVKFRKDTVGRDKAYGYLNAHVISRPSSPYIGLIRENAKRISLRIGTDNVPILHAPDIFSEKLREAHELHHAKLVNLWSEIRFAARYAPPDEHFW